MYDMERRHILISFLFHFSCFLCIQETVIYKSSSLLFSTLLLNSLLFTSLLFSSQTNKQIGDIIQYNTIYT